MIADEVTNKSASLKVLYKKVMRFLQDYYGEDCIECMIFEKIWYEFNVIEVEKANTDKTESVITCKDILICIKKLFEDFSKKWMPLKNQKKRFYNL